MRHPILLSKDREWVGILHEKDSEGNNFAHWRVEEDLYGTFIRDVFEKGDFGGDDPWFCTDKKYTVILPYELT